MGHDNVKIKPLLLIWSKRLQVFLRAYLVGIIATLYAYFFIELLIGLPMPPLFLTLTVTVFIPITVALFATALHIRREPEFRANDYLLPFINQLWRHLHWFLSGALLFGIWAGLYSLVNQLTMGGETRSLQFFFDNYFSIRPEFVFIYLTVYWVFLFVTFGAKEPEESLAILKTGVILISIGVFFHLGFPVEISRPHFEPATFSKWTLAIVYASDNPVSCFPSTHCAMVMLTSLVMLKRNRASGLVVLALAIAVGFSTVFTKQHFVMDVIGGYSLAIIVYAFSFKLGNELPAMKFFKQFKQHYRSFSNLGHEN